MSLEQNETSGLDQEKLLTKWSFSIVIGVTGISQKTI